MNPLYLKNSLHKNSFRVKRCMQGDFDRMIMKSPFSTGVGIVRENDGDGQHLDISMKLGFPTRNCFIVARY
jgi:hypothetical protein